MRKLNNNKRSLFFIIVAIIVLFSFVLARQSPFSPKSFSVNNFEKITVAACPTFYYLLEMIREDFHVHKTSSTAESLGLLKNGVVDLAISGRAPYPNEEGFFGKVMGSGYSFVSSEQAIVLEEDVANKNWG